MIPLIFSLGCGGYYIMTVPDQLARADGEAVPITRLQRNDFFFLAMPADRQPMRFRIYSIPQPPLEDQPRKGPVRACATDELGYAAVKMPMYEKPVENRPGRYLIKVSLQDFEGEEVSLSAPLYVWDPRRAVVAVEADCIPAEGDIEDQAAAEALRKIARTANILYLARRGQTTRQPFHDRLGRGQYPDGPVLLWQRKRWHIVRDGKHKIPRVMVESRLVSQLPRLVKEFPNMKFGLCRTELAARAFVDAGIGCIVVGNTRLEGANLTHRQGWTDLAEHGLGEQP